VAGSGREWPGRRSGEPRVHDRRGANSPGEVDGVAAAAGRVGRRTWCGRVPGPGRVQCGRLRPPALGCRASAETLSLTTSLTTTYPASGPRSPVIAAIRVRTVTAPRANDVECGRPLPRKICSTFPRFLWKRWIDPPVRSSTRNSKALRMPPATSCSRLRAPGGIGGPEWRLWSPGSSRSLPARPVRCRRGSSWPVGRQRSGPGRAGTAPPSPCAGPEPTPPWSRRPRPPPGWTSCR